MGCDASGASCVLGNRLVHVTSHHVMGTHTDFDEDPREEMLPVEEAPGGRRPCCRLGSSGCEWQSQNLGPFALLRQSATAWGVKPQTFTSHSSGGWKPDIEVPADRSLARAPLLACRRRRESSGVSSSYKDTHLITGASRS